jgi:hypothetical protein
MHWCAGQLILHSAHGGAGSNDWLYCCAGQLIPLEILPLGEFDPVYRSTLDVQSGELPVLPLSIYGSVRALLLRCARSACCALHAACHAAHAVLSSSSLPCSVLCALCMQLATLCTLCSLHAACHAVYAVLCMRLAHLRPCRQRWSCIAASCQLALRLFSASEGQYLLVT